MRIDWVHMWWQASSLSFDGASCDKVPSTLCTEPNTYRFPAPPAWFKHVLHPCHIQYLPRPFFSQLYHPQVLSGTWVQTYTLLLLLFFLYFPLFYLKYLLRTDLATMAFSWYSLSVLPPGSFDKKKVAVQSHLINSNNSALDYPALSLEIVVI